MGGYGRTVISGSDGNFIAASDNPKGVRSGEIDWNIVPAATTDMVVPENIQIKAGEKFVRHGSMLCRIMEGDSKGMFGSYDPNATDGRQRISRGEVFILNRTVRQSQQDRVELFADGEVWVARLNIEEGKPPSLADFHKAFNMRFIS